MATVTGTNLLDSVLASTGATMSDAAKLVTAARLQAMIDAGFDTGINVALVLSAASSAVKDAVPVLGDLATTVDTAKTDIEGGTSEFTLTASADSVNEGANVTVKITAPEGSSAGDEVAYTITGIDADDLASGSLTGTVALEADLTANVTINLAEDTVTEGPETLTFSLDGQSVSTNITVNDTSTAATFALTSGDDKLSPTAEDATQKTTDGVDNISGIASALSSERTLDIGDIIDGGNGNDTLNVTMNSSFSGFTTGAGMSNVENVNLTNSTSIARTFDASGVTGVTGYNIDASNAGVSLNDLVEATQVAVNNQKDGSFSISFQDVADTTSDVVGGTEDAMTLSLSGIGVVEDTATDATERKVVTATVGDIEELTIDATGANVIALGSDSAKTITVTGTGSIEVDDIGTAATSFDASAVEGSVTVDTTAAVAGKLATIKTGAGDDKITLKSGDVLANATIAGGDGADTLIWEGEGKTTQVSMTGVETIQLGANATGAELFSAANTTGIETIKVDKDTGAQDVTFAGMGSGNIEVALVGANATAAKKVSVDNSGAATVNITADSATLAKGTENTAAQDNKFDVSLGNASSLVVNAGAYTDSATDIIADKATSVVLNIASGKDSSTTPVELTDFSGTITAAKATSVNVNATGNYTGTITANAASSVIYEAQADTNGTIEADKATAVEVTTGSKDSDIKLNVAKAETIAINANAGLTVTSDDDFESVQELTIDTAGAFTTGVEAYAKMASMQVSGTNTKSAVTVGALGGENDYNLTVVATGMKAGFETGTVQTGSGRDISITTSGLTGNAKTGAISGTNAGTTDVNNVTLTSAGNAGNVEYGAIDADGTLTIANSSTGTFKVGAIGGNAAPSTASINLDGTVGNMTLAAISAGTITFDASSATGTVTYGGELTATKAVNVTGTELKANDVDVALDTTSNQVTASITGGISDDTFLVTMDDDTKGVGTFVVNGGVGAGDSLKIDGATTAGFTSTKATISGIETLTIDNATGVTEVTMNASAISGQTIDLIGSDANDDLFLTGTDNSDTIDLSNMTTSGNDLDLFIDAGKGNDTIKLTAATVSVETVKFGTVFSTNGTDSVSAFKAGEDKIDFDFGDTGGLANNAALRGTGADLDTDGGTAGNGLVATTGFLTSSTTQTDLDVDTAITYLKNYEGSTAESDLVAGDALYFALDTNKDTAIYLFQDADSDAIVDAGEVVKLVTLVGLADASSITGTETVDFT